jgi:hypothetical protein
MNWYVRFLCTDSVKFLLLAIEPVLQMIITIIIVVFVIIVIIILEWYFLIVTIFKMNVCVFGVIALLLMIQVALFCFLFVRVWIVYPFARFYFIIGLWAV